MTRSAVEELTMPGVDVVVEPLPTETGQLQETAR
ncbi:hypothetical protein H4696_002998 [Amycolatopsis lexingtonensis]|uniref:Uncharacterized protein n=1 Tax=Amycolatopsis lexingtonensis TaxID=218822 RepID=A0ABR9HY86_9PSEU|nr:hypothetical protein [Amycolatopsis lexingtonensis]